MFTSFWQAGAIREQRKKRLQHNLSRSIWRRGLRRKSDAYDTGWKTKTNREELIAVSDG
jgi:hypothetical protein